MVEDEQGLFQPSENEAHHGRVSCRCEPSPEAPTYTHVYGVTCVLKSQQTLAALGFEVVVREV